MSISEKNIGCIRYLAIGRIVRLISTIMRSDRPAQFVVELGLYPNDVYSREKMS